MKPLDPKFFEGMKELPKFEQRERIQAACDAVQPDRLLQALKQYLGDSVYADFDGFAVTLTTENGLGPTNTIILEPEVVEALLRYREWAKQRASEIAATQPQKTL